MNISLAVWIPLIVVVLVSVVALAGKLSSSSCSADALPLFLRHVNLQLLESLLDPIEEARLRSDLSAAAFRRLQRDRIRGAIEQLGRITHNATILMQWANREYAKIAHKGRAQFDHDDHLIVSVMESAIQVKRSAAWARMKVMLWRVMLVRVWTFFPSPSLSDLREVSGRDLLQGYESLTSSVGHLLLLSGEELYDQVRAAL